MSEAVRRAQHLVLLAYELARETRDVKPAKGDLVEQLERIRLELEAARKATP